MGRKPGGVGPVGELNRARKPPNNPPPLSTKVLVPKVLVSGTPVAPAPTRAGSSLGFSRKAIGEPPTKIRLAALDTIRSEFLVSRLAIAKRFSPERK